MLISGVQQFTMIDYPGQSACIVFTAGCNFRCGYCHNPEFVLPELLVKIKKDFIPEETFLNFLDQRKGLLDGVVVTGGEPTIMPDLKQFIKKIKDKGYLVKLDTNGTNPKLVKELIAEKLIDYLALDVKSSVAGYKGLVGPRGDTDAIKETIALLVGGVLPYEFRSTLVKEIHTDDVLSEMLPLVKGGTKLYLQTFRPGHTLDAKFTGFHPFTLNEMENIAERFRMVVGEVTIRS